MKNVFVEGIQGSGKTTLANCLSIRFPALRVYREGEYSPVELAWCAWMTKEEYTEALRRFESDGEEIRKNTFAENNHLIVTFTRIETEQKALFDYFEQYEIYNARKTLEQFKQIVFSRFRNFSQSGCLFECSIFQNIMEELILYQMLTDDEIVQFYQELYSLFHQEDFLLFYLHSVQLEENIRRIRFERCDGRGEENWYPMMMEYLKNSPYGRKNKLSSFQDLILHFEHRQQLELRVIREVIGERAVIIPSKQFELDEALFGWLI